MAHQQQVRPAENEWDEVALFDSDPVIAPIKQEQEVDEIEIEGDSDVEIIEIDEEVIYPVALVPDPAAAPVINSIIAPIKTEVDEPEIEVDSDVEIIEIDEDVLDSKHPDEIDLVEDTIHPDELVEIDVYAIYPVADSNVIDSVPDSDALYPVADSDAIDPVSDSVDPVSDSVDPVSDAIDPVSDAIDPVTDPDAIDPVSDAIDPVTDPDAIDPVSDAIDPVTDPDAIDPVEDPDSVDPLADPVADLDAIDPVADPVAIDPVSDADVIYPGAINSEQNVESCVSLDEATAPNNNTEQPEESSPSPTILISPSPPSHPLNWREGKTIPQQMEFIFEHDNCLEKDITFLVGEMEEEISAHKQFLSLASPVFERELYRHPAIQNFGQLSIPLPDVKPTTFRLLLRYIYTRKLELESINAFELLNVAKRFELLDLADNCREILRKEIRDDNAAEILTAAWDFNEPWLKELTLNYIHQNAKMVLLSDGFLDVPHAALREVFNNDNLNADEISVFQSAIRWAQHWIRKRTGIENMESSGEDIRNELQDVIYCIRFPIMTPQEFTDNVVNRGILKKADMLKIYRFFNSSEINKFDPQPFSKDNRAGGTERHGESESSGESEQCEPPRKSRRIDNRIDLNGLETVARIETSPSPPIIMNSSLAELQHSVKVETNDLTNMSFDEPRASTSAAFSTPRIIRSTTTVNVERDSEPAESVLEVNNEENPRKKPRKLLSEHDKDYLRVTKNTHSKLYNRILHQSLNNLEELTTINDVHEQTVIDPNISLLPISIPQLKEFKVDYLFDGKNFSDLKNYLQSLNLESTLLFVKPGINDLSALWKREINVCIKVNKLTILNMEHESKSLTISRINKSSKSIMERLKGTSIRKIHLEEIKIKSLDLIPTKDLEVMTLRKVHGIQNRAKFLRKCKKLEEFSACDMGDETIDFGIDFGFLTRPGTRLRRIALGKAKLHCSNPFGKLDNQLEELYLDNCTLTSEFIDAFPFIFPNLKKIKVCPNHMESSVQAKLFVKIFEIDTIEWVGVWNLPIKQAAISQNRRSISKNEHDAECVREILDNVDFRGDSSRINSEANQTIIIYNLNVRKVTSQHGTHHQSCSIPEQFRQRIKAYGQRWVGEKLMGSAKCEKFLRLDYKHFGWNEFYTKFHLFHKMNKTNRY